MILEHAFDLFGVGVGTPPLYTITREIAHDLIEQQKGGVLFCGIIEPEPMPGHNITITPTLTHVKAVVIDMFIEDNILKVNVELLEYSNNSNELIHLINAFNPTDKIKSIPFSFVPHATTSHHGDPDPNVFTLHHLKIKTKPV